MIAQYLLNYRAYSTILIINDCIAERSGLSKDMRCCNVFVMHGGGARNVSGTSLQIKGTDKICAYTISNRGLEQASR